MKSAWGLMILVIMTGCGAGRKAAFIQSEYDPYSVAGNGRITGQAFVRTRDGEVKLSAGLQVHLTPVTTYSSEWWRQVVQEGKWLKASDWIQSPFYRVTIGGVDGKFFFQGLSPGQYYMACEIRWEVGDRFLWVRNWSGAIVGEVVSIERPDQAVDVVLRPLTTKDSWH